MRKNQNENVVAIDVAYGLQVHLYNKRVFSAVYYCFFGFFFSRNRLEANEN